MAGRNGQELLSAWVPSELAERFRAQTRASDGGASAALRRLVTEAVEGHPPGRVSGGGSGEQVRIRLKAAERQALQAAADQRGTTAANWARSLLLAHLARRPQWTPAELDALRDLFREVSQIGGNVNQVARAMNTAAHTGQYPPGQAEEVAELVGLVRAEMRRIVAVMHGNWDYWGLPDAERPTAAPGVVAREAHLARVERARRSLRPRRRPKRFADNSQGTDPASLAASTVLSPVGERVAQDALRQVLATMPPRTVEQTAALLAHARVAVLAQEQAGEVLADPG